MKTKKYLILTLTAIVMTAMALSCGDNPSNGNNSESTAPHGRGDNHTSIENSLPNDSTDSIKTDTVGGSTPIPQEFVKAEKKALLIGVGNYKKYPDHKEAEWGHTSSHNDIELLSPTLESLGFVVIERTDDKATRDKIDKAFNELINLCNPGDTVLVHFSGHGQRMVDKVGDEQDGKTECFIPYDAQKVYSNQYKGEKHLTDDAIHDYINAIREKLGSKGFLIITFDSCYSGGVNRAANSISNSMTKDGPQIRGDNDVFGRDSIPRAIYQPRVERKDPNYANYVTISACQPNEENKEEYKPDKYGKIKIYGPLSWILNEKLIEMKNGKLTFDELANSIKNDDFWKGRNHKQTPYIDKNDEFYR